MDSTLPVAIPCKSQRGWLIAFGIIEILISCGLVFMTLFSAYILLGPARAKMPASPIPPLGLAVMAVLQYQLLAVLFFTGGIGSILCKNWARILMLVVSGLWLGIGIMSTLTMALAFSATTHHHLGNMPAGTVGRVAVMFTFAIVMMVVLPAICLIFYSRKSVRATCLTQKGAPPGGRNARAWASTCCGDPGCVAGCGSILSVCMCVRLSADYPVWCSPARSSRSSGFVDILRFVWLRRLDGFPAKSSWLANHYFHNWLRDNIGAGDYSPPP